MTKDLGYLALLICTLVVYCPRALAQNAQSQLWPEFNTYVKISPRTRVSLTANRSTDGLTFDSAQIGPSVDITFKPLLHKILNNDNPNQYFRFRAGYRYITSASGPAEDRLLLEWTGRYPLPLKLLASDRSRGDLRLISREFSWRYRNRLTLERSLKAGRVWLTPFARGELFYDSRYDKWNQNAYGFGLVLPIGTELDLEAYYEHRNNSRASPAHVNAAGLSISFYMEAKRQ